MDPNETSRLDGIDRAELEAYVKKRLEEENAKRSGSAVKLESFRLIGDILVLFVLGMFIVSPFIQLMLRIINGADDQPLMVTSYYVRYYQWTIKNIHYIACFTAVLMILWKILYLIVRRREGVSPERHASVKEMLVRMLPQIIFVLFALWIVLATVIRGPNEYDLTGHPYMYESIYSYICYALVYFFCGTMVFRSSYKRILLYALIFTALPVNIFELVNEWFTKIRYFNGAGVCAVFHNSNHYGYYLVLVILSSAILFVYEKKLAWRIIDAVSAVIGTMVLVINNTFGAFLAVLIVLICFAVYAFLKDRRYFKWALIVLGGFLLVTAMMSIKYNTVLSSTATFAEDMGSIISDPLESDNAGSKRWKLWKGTVQHLPERPFTGFGVEGLLNTYYIGTPHNELLQYAEFFGIPAALLYLSAVVFVIASVMKHCRKLSKMTLVCFCVSVGYFASSMFGCAIYYTTPFFYIFLGLTYAELFRGKPAAPSEENTQ